MRFILFWILLLPFLLGAQNASEVFGKNKIQYNRDQHDWWIYETTNFVFYWYGRSKNSAQFGIEICETLNTDIQSLFEYHLKDKIEVIIYADHSDAMQSNLAILDPVSNRNWDVEPKVVDQTIRLFFDGSHVTFANDLKRGILKVYFNSMFSGSSFQQVVQKIISYRLPDWFENGLIDFLSDGWNPNDLRELNALWNKKKSFTSFSKHQPDLAGKSFWHFISTTYGKKSISDFLYMARINKEINRASKIVFQTQFSNLENSWKYYYQHEIEKQKPSEYQNKIKLKSNEKIIDFEWSKYFESFIVTTNQFGKLRLRTLDLSKKKVKTKSSFGSKTRFIRPSNYYPIYLELKNGEQYGIITEKQNRIFCAIRTKQNEKSNIIFPAEIQQVYDAIFLSEDEILFSAKGNGFVDIYSMQFKTRQLKKLTEDIYDDLKIGLGEDHKIYFTSNRKEATSTIQKIDSIFPTNKMSIYSITKQAKVSKESILKEANNTDSSLNSTKDPVIFNELNDFETAIQHNKGFLLLGTHSKKSHLLLSNNKLLNLFEGPENKYYSEEIEDFSLLRLNEEQTLIQSKDSSVTMNSKEIKPQVQHSQEKFISEFGSSKFKDKLLQEFSKPKHTVKDKIPFMKVSSDLFFPDVHDYNSSLTIAYRDRFKIEELSYDINNSILFNGLNTYSGFQKDYNTPKSGLLVKARVKENFENYWIECGFRFPFDFKGSEAYILFENNKKRWDHQYAIYRKYTKETVSANTVLATNTFLVNHIAKYALDHHRSFRLNSTFRNDHNFFLLTNKSILDTIGKYHQRIGTRLEYVFDNVFNYSININDGWQSKVFAEASKRINSNDNFSSISLGEGFLFLLGADIRYHKNILKRSSWSNRFYTIASFGSEEILYSLGGTENWLFPKYNREVNPSLQGNYAYQGLTTEVRGHYLGARKGSSSLCFSSEIRIPFLQYLLHSSWKNSFFRNLQFVGFLDYGMSWNGLIPKWNEVSTQVFQSENPSVKIKLNYPIDPFIAGNGFGLRSALFGYFLRLDYAWKLDRTGWKDPVFHLSLGLDF